MTPRRISRLFPAIAVAALVALASCSAGDDADRRAVPRRTAYPRLRLPDTVMAPVADFPALLEVNAQAAVTSPRPGWLNVAYPALGAVLHITYTASAPPEIDEVKANRMRRLMLNAGDRPSRQSEFVNPAGFDILMIRTESSSTPLQFVATDDSTAVVSGAVYFSDPAVARTENTDSIAPAIDAIERDLAVTLARLDHAKN